MVVSDQLHAPLSLRPRKEHTVSTYEGAQWASRAGLEASEDIFHLLEFDPKFTECPDILCSHYPDFAARLPVHGTMTLQIWPHRFLQHSFTHLMLTNFYTV